MRKTKVLALISVIILIGTTLFFTRRNVDSNMKIKVSILEEQGSGFIFQKLKYIPKNIDRRFHFQLYKEKDETKIFFVEYIYNDIQYAYYYIVDADKKIKKLKAAINKSESIDSWENADLIDKDVFNYIVKEFNWHKKDIIRDNFCYLLSNFYEKEYSSPLNDMKDYEKIIDNLKIGSNNILLTSILSESQLKDLLESKSGEDFYYWYYDQGIMKFNFGFTNGRIDYVDSEFVGHLGNEIVPI